MSPDRRRHGSRHAASLGVGRTAPLSERRRDVPRDSEAVCLKCLKKEYAKHRYLTANDLVRDLEHTSTTVSARPIGLVQRAAKAYRRQRRAIRLVATSVSIALLAAVILLQRLPKGAAIEVNSATYTRDIAEAFNLWNENAERLRDNPHAGEEMTALLERADSADRTARPSRLRVAIPLAALSSGSGGRHSAKGCLVQRPPGRCLPCHVFGGRVAPCLGRRRSNGSHLESGVRPPDLCLQRAHPRCELGRFLAGRNALGDRERGLFDQGLGRCDR